MWKYTSMPSKTFDHNLKKTTRSDCSLLVQSRSIDFSKGGMCHRSVISKEVHSSVNQNSNSRKQV